MAKKKGQNKSKPLPKKKKGVNSYVYLIILALLIIFVYARTNTFEYVHIDDGILLHENLIITDSNVSYSEVFKAKLYQPYYKPLVFLSWKIQWNLFGGDAWHFHFVNWLLHLANAIILFFIGRHLFSTFIKEHKTIVLSSFLLAAFFALNPLRVESVAWVTERKDVLFSFFFLLSWLSYIRYYKKNNYLFLFLAAALYLFSGLSKSMGITLVAILFVQDLLEGRKWKLKLLLEKTPFIVVTFLLFYLYGFFNSNPEQVASVGAEAQQVAQFSSSEIINSLPSFLQVILVGSVNFILWLIHSLLPFKLSVVYPHDSILSSLSYAIFLFPLLVIALYLIAFIRRRVDKTYLVGLLFFGIALAPVLVYSSAGQGIFLSDRYTYIPSIGIFLILVHVFNTYLNRKGIWAYLPHALVLIYFLLSIQAVSYWKNTETLFSQVLRVNDKAELAYINLGVYNNEQKKPSKAIDYYTQGIKKNPSYSALYRNRGRIYFDQGKMDMAMSDFNKAISLDENEVTSLANRAAIYGTRGDFQRSLADLNRALELDPTHNNALLNRGLVYFRLGNYAKCIEDYEIYLEYVPDNSNVVNTTGLAYLNMKDAENALPWFDRSIKMNNTNGAYYYNRSRAYATLTNKSAALQDALQARKLGYIVPQEYIDLLQ